MRDNMSAAELRNVETGTYLVVDLHDDEYWQSGEGEVTGVAEYDSGAVHVTIDHTSRLKIPADARKGLVFDGAARGANGLRVSGVRKR